MPPKANISALKRPACASSASSRTQTRNVAARPDPDSDPAEAFGDTAPLPPGPATLKELYLWPTTLARSLTCEEAARVRDLLKDGVIITSDYSGQDTYREALTVGLIAISQQHSLDLDPELLRFVRSCDYAEAPRKVLSGLCRKLDPKGAKGCVLDCMNNRLVTEACRFLDSAQPEQHMSKQAKAAAYEEIGKWLDDNSSWIFAKECPCLTHKKMCTPPVPGQHQA